MGVLEFFNAEQIFEKFEKVPERCYFEKMTNNSNKIESRSLSMGFRPENFGYEEFDAIKNENFELKAKIDKVNFLS